MKRVSLIFIAMVLGLVLAGGSAFALDFGTEITIFDKNGDKDAGLGIAGEDQETEPGMVNSQVWDLEGIFFKDNGELTIVGGFDFENGVIGNGIDFDSGDIFIDTDLNAIYGDMDDSSPNGNEAVNNTFGYDYVIAFHYLNDNLDVSTDSNGNTTGTYDIIKLGEDSYTYKTYYDQNGGSNPWRYARGGVETIASGLTFSYQTGVADTGFSGTGHNALTVDISALFPYIDDEFIVHMTQECGNDNIMGRGANPVPEPATIVLLGVGLLGVGALHRRNRKK